MQEVSSRLMVEVREVSKKFCKDLKYNMYYGSQDVLRQTLGLPLQKDILRKHEFWALDRINLDIHEGEILAVIGSNGSGKTTLMRLLSNIYSLDGGRIHLHGVRKVTSVFALNIGLNPLFTGIENIRLKGAMFGMSKQELEDKLDFIIDFSELSEFLNTPVGNYSSGMKARLAYSVALATEPDLFIIDEALAVGDSLFKTKCYENLKEYVRQPGRAVVYVTNRIQKVLAVATRVIVLDKSHLVYDSPDSAAALEFYIHNCLKGLTDELKDVKLKKVREYEM